MDRFLALGFDAHEATMLDDAFEAITRADMWEYLRLPSTPGKDGFMFSPAIELAAINAEMKYEGHSGASYAWTMRQMELIAKKGWDVYRSATRAARARQVLEEEEAAQKRQSDRSGLPSYGSVCSSGRCGVAGGGVPACDH